MTEDTNFQNIDNTNNQSNSTSTTKNSNNDNEWLYGDLYPQRRKEEKKLSFYEKIFRIDAKQDLRNSQCELNVYWCLRNSPLVKLMLAALKTSGCEFDFRRHISCEVCDSKVSGGYDPEFNQVVVCQNVATRRSTVQGVLTHEMIHMFDYCRNDLDLKNIHHLACTEIRAANLAHCSFASAWIYGNTSIFNMRKTHRECVRKKALSSILALKQVSEEEALRAIDYVFPKCYNDLEPIGRRCRRNSMDLEMAYLEAPLYGYDYRI